MDVIDKVLSYAYEAGFQIEDVSFSPITGPKGNIEFLGYGFKRKLDEELNYYDENAYRTLVEDAHSSLKK